MWPSRPRCSVADDIADVPTKSASRRRLSNIRVLVDIAREVSRKRSMIFTLFTANCGHIDRNCRRRALVRGSIKAPQNRVRFGERVNRIGPVLAGEKALPQPRQGRYRRAQPLHTVHRVFPSLCLGRTKCTDTGVVRINLRQPSTRWMRKYINNRLDL